MCFVFVFSVVAKLAETTRARSCPLTHRLEAFVFVRPRGVEPVSSVPTVTSREFLLLGQDGSGGDPSLVVWVAGI